MPRKKVLLAMSGGVDSSVAAKILLDQGYELIGATIKTWESDSCKSGKAKGCCSLDDVEDARQVADKLGFPFYVLDLHTDFKTHVIDDFVKNYIAGKTPNPCIRCNNHIKFGMFLNKADELGCDFMATGHYAQRKWDDALGRWFLYEGIDKNKDQSYVLFGLKPEQLARTLLPVGSYNKDSIRAMAADLGLKVAAKADSQEICFVDGHYSDVVRKFGGKLPGEGQIVDSSGKVLGFHKGYYHYTIGQRRGLDLPDKTPYYVTSIEPDQNRITVGKKEDTLCQTFEIQDLNWFVKPEQNLRYTVKIRSRHSKTPAQLIQIGSDKAVFCFDTKQEAVTAGQAAVVYEGERVLGGGWIA